MCIICILYCNTCTVTHCICFCDPLHGTLVQAVEAQVAVVEGEKQGLSEHLEEWRLKVTAVEAELEEARRDLEREREDNRRKSMDMQQEAEKWRADASKTEVWLH